MFGRKRELEDALETMTVNLAQEAQAHAGTKTRYETLIEDYTIIEKFNERINSELGKTRDLLQTAKNDLEAAKKEYAELDEWHGELHLHYDELEEQFGFLTAEHTALKTFLQSVNFNVDVKTKK